MTRRSPGPVVSAESETSVRIAQLRAAAYSVPTETAEADGTLSWSGTTIVVVEAHAADVVGLGWTYAHRSCVDFIHDALAPVVCGRDVLDVPASWQAMQCAVRNQGRPGLVSCAMSAVEIALQDAAARVDRVPLARRLGGRAHERVAVYGSGGFTTYSDAQLRAQLRRYIHTQGMRSVKIKVGESWGNCPRRDLARVATARAVLGDEAALYVDANGAYSAAQAIRVGKAFDDLGVEWYEEPVSSDDLDGLRDVRTSVVADVAAGEYGYHLPYFAGMLAAGAVDCLQIDVTRCGGLGEWSRIAALAAARNVDVSAHCAQNLAAHAAVATHNVRHLEWFRDHERIERLLFDGVLEPSQGRVSPDMSTPGHGMWLKQRDAEQYRVA